MNDPSDRLLDLLSPFHACFDDDWVVTRIGSGLQHQFDQSPVGKPLAEVFRLQWPAATDAELREHLGKITVFTCVGTELQLRGQLIDHPGGGTLLVGTPWVTSLEELEQTGLALDQLAPHDPSGDFILLLSAAREQAADLERVIGQLGDKERRIRESAEEARRLSLVAARTTNAVVLTDAKGRIEWVNEAFHRLTGYSQEEAMGQTPGSLLQGPDTDPETVQYMRDCIRRGEGFTTEVLNYTRAGDPYWVQVEVQPVRDDKGDVVEYMAIEADITEQVKRRLLDERIGTLIRLAERTISSFLHEDLDRTVANVLPELGDVLGADRAVFATFVEPGASLSPWLSWARDGSSLAGLTLAERTELATWTAEVGPSTHVLLVGSDKVASSGWPLRTDASHGVLAVPVVTDSGAQAVLAFEVDSVTSRWTEEEANIVVAVAQGLARAMERRSATARLEAALEQAREASRAKSEFLANMSHEIRTPMTAIVGHAELLSRNNVDTDRKHKWALQLRRNADHLLALVGDVLDLSKIEAGEMEIQAAECDLGKEVSDVVALMRPRAQEKLVRFETRGEGRVPSRVKVDSLRMRQVLMNLVSNAIKFTVEGSVEVSVDCSAVAPGSSMLRLRFIVKDTGCGIPKDAQRRIFDPFVQSGGVSRARELGTGLGLAISKSLAQLMGGDIHVSSEVGHGSSFVLELSVSAVDGCDWIPGNEVFSILDRPQSVPEAGETFRGLTAHVVDDSPDIVEIVRLFLEEGGAVVTSSNNGSEAVQFLLEREPAERPDIVFMDMMMPVMNGYAATLKLRNEGYDGPIVALTAFAMSDDREKCLSAGCDAYVSKPIVPEKLRACVADVARRKSPSSDLTSAAPEIRSNLEGSPRFRTLLVQYMEGLQTMVEELEQALTEEDAKRVAVIAHRLRGTGQSYGFPEVTEVAGRCEDSIRRESPWAESLPLARDLVGVLRRVRVDVD